MTLMYPAIALKSLSLWNCVAVGPVSYITDDLSLSCAGSTYVAYSAFNVVFVIGVVLGAFFVVRVVLSFFLVLFFSVCLPCFFIP